MKLILNVATEDSELLERIEVDVTDDHEKPLGNTLATMSVIHDLESAARIVQARAKK